MKVEFSSKLRIFSLSQHRPEGLSRRFLRVFLATLKSSSSKVNMTLDTPRTNHLQVNSAPGVCHGKPQPFRSGQVPPCVSPKKPQASQANQVAKVQEPHPRDFPSSLRCRAKHSTVPACRVGGVGEILGESTKAANNPSEFI